MAQVYPDGWRQVPAEGAAARLLETLSVLAEGLPDDFRVYHGIHWTRVDDGHLLFGEIDFIVVGPGGHLLLIEQASGFLEEGADGLLRKVARARRQVSVALARTADHVRTRLAQCLDGVTPTVDVLLFCPDYQVRQPGSAGLDPARIVDAPRRDDLLAVVRALLEQPLPESPSLGSIHRFLIDSFELVPEVGAIVGQTHALYTRLAGGLAEWARRIEVTPHRLRVTGTAGSGKTQLAMAVFREAIAAGKQPLYVCYNRPLADHIARIAPTGGMVASYHQLCNRMLRAAGLTPDFSRPGAFAWMEAAFAQLSPSAADRFDVIIVDEGQDFLPGWRDRVLALARADCALWWLEDPMQNLYERPEIELPGWVRIRSERNYRSPADIVALLNGLPDLSAPVRAGSPLAGAEVEWLIWHDEESLLERTRRAITRAIGLGFRRDMIALITFRGREHSRLSHFERLGQHRLRSFRGDYDLHGDPVYSEGELLIDSVYRFKGQAAPCVIFTEVDFAAFDQRTLRKLFVGATRAGMKLIMVVSERAAALLAATSQGD